MPHRRCSRICWCRSTAITCPLYRQSEIYARDGVDLDRSTLCGWVGRTAWLLAPIVEGIRRHVLAAEKIHGDDTTVPVPGLGRTKTGGLWVYVRDDRPFCGTAPPAAAYFYSPDHAGEHPAQHSDVILWNQRLFDIFKPGSDMELGSAVRDPA